MVSRNWPAPPRREWPTPDMLRHPLDRYGVQLSGPPTQVLTVEEAKRRWDSLLGQGAPLTQLIEEDKRHSESMATTSPANLNELTDARVNALSANLLKRAEQLDQIRKMRALQAALNTFKRAAVELKACGVDYELPNEQAFQEGFDNVRESLGLTLSTDGSDDLIATGVNLVELAEAALEQATQWEANACKTMHALIREGDLLEHRFAVGSEPDRIAAVFQADKERKGG